MPIFRPPEVPTRFGALHDEAFVDGSVADAGIEREVLRDHNSLVGAGHLVKRWFTRLTVPPGDEAGGYGRAIAAPFWEAAIPLPVEGLPVRKKWGLERLSLDVMAVVELDRVVELFLATSISPDPKLGGGPTLVMRGTGALETYSAEGIRCRRGAGEEIALFARGRIDPTSDPLLDTGTYGGTDTGTIDSAPTLFTLVDAGAGWNATGARVHQGGHYVVTRDAAGALRMGAAEIRAVGPDIGGGVTDTLFFWPPATDQRHLIGATYEIRKLPTLRYVSIAVYAEDRG